MKNKVWELYVDGAARNNPGPAGAGIYLLCEGKPVEKQGFFLGSRTNNQAEYLALLLGLAYAERHMGPDDRLIIKADSELMIRQITGRYRVKNPGLLRIYSLVMRFLKTLHYQAVHIPRAQNAQADKLANLGIDRKLPVPADLWSHEEAL